MPDFSNFHGRVKVGEVGAEGEDEPEPEEERKEGFVRSIMSPS